jgi:hypothetical protein
MAAKQSTAASTALSVALEQHYSQGPTSGHEHEQLISFGDRDDDDSRRHLFDADPTSHPRRRLLAADAGPPRLSHRDPQRTVAAEAPP